MHDSRSDDNEQFVFALIDVAALKQLAQDGDVADAGNFLKLFGYAIIQQPGDGETLPIGELHLGFDAIRGDCRDDETLQSEGIGEIQRADLGLNLQMDLPVWGQGGSEIQTDAKLFELNGDSGKTGTAARLQDREWEFATSQEAGLFPRFGHQVRFGQNFQGIASFERLNRGREIDVGPKDEDIEQVTEADCGSRAISAVHELRRSKLLCADDANILRSRKTQEVEAQLAHSGAINFGEAHLQQDLSRGRSGNLHQAGDFGS